MSSEFSSSQSFGLAPVLPRLLSGPTSIADDNLLQTSNGVGTTTQVYKEMMARWELVIHLMGGTLAMRVAKTKYLPQEEGEEPTLYDARLVRTILYGIYSRTIKSLSAIPFIDPIICTDIPEELDYLKTHATDEKLSLAELAQDILEDALNFGLGHFLVDFPVVPSGLNLKEERDLGAKPFFARISPVNLIGWKFEDGTLTEIRIYEYSTEQDTDFLEVPVHKIRVVTPEFHTIFTLQETKDQGGKATSGWVQTEQRTNKLGYVGLVTTYGNKDGAPLTGTPVMEELAWLNLRHYQKQSDLDNIEHVANTPVLFASGFNEDELNDIVVGSHSLIGTTAELADLKYVEHTGAAIAASQNSIKAIEQRAAEMGAEFLAQPAGSRQTAYAKSVDTGKSLSILQAIVNNLSRSLERGYVIAGDWINLDQQKLANTGVKVGEGIDLSLDSNDLAQLRELAKDGYLTTLSLQYELQRRGKISDSTELVDPQRSENNDVSGDDGNGNEGDS